MRLVTLTLVRSKYQHKAYEQLREQDMETTVIHISTRAIFTVAPPTREIPGVHACISLPIGEFWVEETVDECLKRLAAAEEGRDD